MLTVVHDAEEANGNEPGRSLLDEIGRDRVAVLNDGVEQPSDFVGVGYISYSGNWKDELADELRAAGFNVA